MKHRKKHSLALPGSSRRKWARRGRAVGDFFTSLLFSVSEGIVDFGIYCGKRIGSGISAIRRKKKAAATQKGYKPVAVQQRETVFRPVDKKGIQPVRFKDVIGTEEAKQAITDRIITPVRHSQKAEALGIVECGGSVLLIGPGGNGKSLLAKAVANEVNMVVFEINASDIIRKSQQDSLYRVDCLFDTISKYKRVLIIMNEAEGVLRDTQSPIMQAVNAQFLTRSSGFLKSDVNDRIIMMLGTSNRPEMLRPEMKRTGRFSVIFIGLPNKDNRYELFVKTVGNTPSVGIDYEALAESTRLASCADIADKRDGLVRKAKDRALMRSQNLPDNKVYPVSMSDFETVLVSFRPSIGRNDLKKWYPNGLDSLT